MSDGEPAEPSRPTELDPPAAGKAGAFMPLFLRNQRRMYAYAFTLAMNRADADDVFQESSVVMWEKFDPVRPPDDFAAWGGRIIYFKALQFRKRQRDPRVVFSQAVFEQIAETAFEQAASLRLDDRLDALERCLARLPVRDRDLLARRFRPGATVQAVAGEVGRSVSFVYKALEKVFQVLSECVARSVEGAR